MVQRLQKRKSSAMKNLLSSSAKSLIENEKRKFDNEKTNSPTLSAKSIPLGNAAFELKNLILRKKSSKEKDKNNNNTNFETNFKFDIEVKQRKDCPTLPMPKLKCKDNSKGWKTEKLFEALIDNDFNKTRRLIITEGMDINEISPDGNTLLHVASATGNIDCLNMLLECGAVVNVKDRFSRTPLEYAVFYGNFDSAQILIEYGADTSRIKDGIV